MVLNRNNVDWWCERGILCLVLGLVAFAAAAFGAMEPWSFAVLQAGAIPVFILWALRLWVSERPKMLWPPLAWAVLGFMGLALGRYFTAEIEIVAREEVLQVLLYGFLFFVVLNNLRGQDNAETSSAALLILGTLIAAYASGQLAAHSNLIWNRVSHYPGRASGCFATPNSLAGFLGLLLPLAVAFLLVGKVSTMTRILLGYALVLMGVGLAATFSRMGWAAGVAGMVLPLGILLGHRNHRLKALALLVLLLAGGTLFVNQYLAKHPNFHQRLALRSDSEPGAFDFQFREGLWRAAARIWRDHFWLGVGPGHFLQYFGAYRPEDNQFNPQWVHNDYLNLLADWGLAGALIVAGGMGLLVVGLFQTWPHVRREENIFGTAQSNRFAFFLGAVGGVSALMVHSLTDFNLHIPGVALVGTLQLALLTAQLRYASESYWVRAPLVTRWILPLALLIGVGILASNLSRRGPEAYYLAQSEKVETYSAAYAAFLQKAYAAEPGNFQTAYDVGEHYLKTSLEGGSDYAILARQAMDWFFFSLRLNPRHSDSLLGIGMALDWLGRHDEAEKYFLRAEPLEPNSRYLVGKIGWHYMESGDYAAARAWLRRAVQLGDGPGQAGRYLSVCEKRLAERAFENTPRPPDF